jgi:hypothetical protein
MEGEEVTMLRHLQIMDILSIMEEVDLDIMEDIMGEDLDIIMDIIEICDYKLFFNYK